MTRSSQTMVWTKNLLPDAHIDSTIIVRLRRVPTVDADRSPTQLLGLTLLSRAARCNSRHPRILHIPCFLFRSQQDQCHKIGILPSYCLPNSTNVGRRVSVVGVTRGIQWWDLRMPVHCNLVNRGNSHAKILRGHPVAFTTAGNTQDTERFNRLFDVDRSATDPSAPSHEQL